MKLLRNVAAAAVAFVCLVAGGSVLADGMVVKDGNGIPKTVCSKTQTGQEIPCHVLMGKKPDGTYGPINTDASGNVVLSAPASEAAPGSDSTKATGVQGVTNGKPVAVAQPLFTPTGPATLSVSTSSARIALPTADPVVILVNNGTADIYYLLGNSGVTATTSSFLLPVGSSLNVAIGANTHIAGITAAGTSSLSLTQGTGLPQLSGGVGANANAVTASISDCAAVTIGCKIDNAWDLSSSSATEIAINKAIALKLESIRAVLVGGIPVTGPLTNAQLTAAGLALASNQTSGLAKLDTLHADIATTIAGMLGAAGSTVCSSDTGSCPINAQNQRLLQQFTSLLSLMTTLNGKIDTLNGYASGTTPADTYSLPNAGANYGLVTVASSALETGHVIKAAPGNFYGFSGVTGATAGNFLVFNSTTVPAAGTVAPKKCYPVAANSPLAVGYNPPLYFDTGISIAFSSASSCLTKTDSATAFISGDAK